MRTVATLLLCLATLLWAAPIDADPYNRGGPPRGGSRVQPPTQPGARVPPRLPDAARQRQTDAQRTRQKDSEGDEATETAESDEPFDVGEELDEILDEYDAEERERLGGEIMDEFLDNAGSDKPADEVLRDAIDTVLSRRGVDQETRDAAGEAATGGIWGSGSEDHPHDTESSEPPEAGPPKGPVVRVGQDQVDRIVRDELTSGASPAEVQRQVDELNEALGGSGSVPIPDYVPVQTAAGETMVMSAGDAADYDAARREADAASAEASRIRERIDEINAETDRWTFWEQNSDLRAVAGIAEIFGTVGESDAARAAIDDQIDSLRQEPRPEVIWHHNEDGDWVYAGTGKTEYGGQVYDDWDSAMADYERHPERVAGLERERDAIPSDVDRIQRQTRTRMGTGEQYDTSGGERNVMASTARGDAGEGSMFNRPSEMLGELETERDALIGQYGNAVDRKRRAEARAGAIAGRNR